MSYQYSIKDLEKIRQAESEKHLAQQYGVSFCTVENEEYPAALASMKRIPPVLYYKGNIKIVNRHKNIAVIGSREASQKGLKWARETGTVVAQRGLNLVNGLALGCDTKSLEGALEAGGKCIAILPCGLDQIYPQRNKELAEEILKTGGCLLSEYPIGTKPEKYRYVERDRLQSGISQGVLVIEAKEKSGTMHTAQYAVEQYKRLACYYSRLLELSSGNRYLEDTGKATVIKKKEDLEVFLNDISKEQIFEQLSFVDIY